MVSAVSAWPMPPPWACAPGPSLNRAAVYTRCVVSPSTLTPPATCRPSLSVVPLSRFLIANRSVDLGLVLDPSQDLFPPVKQKRLEAGHYYAHQT